MSGGLTSSTTVARPSARTALGRLGLWVRLAAVLGLAGLAAGFMIFVGMVEQPASAPPRHAEGIVALTGGADRVSDALDLLIEGGGERLLISGVNPTTSAANLVRSAPGARRLLGCCIELGYEAENTAGNARETRLWVRHHNIRSLIVVTSDYHMPRALAEIGDAVPGVELIPAPVVSDRAEGRGVWSDAQRLRLVGVEYFKYLVVLARTHLHPNVAGGEDAASLGAPHLRQGGPCSSCARSSSTSSSTPS